VTHISKKGSWEGSLAGELSKKMETTGRINRNQESIKMPSEMETKRKPKFECSGTKN